MKLLHALDHQFSNMIEYNELSQMSGFNYKDLKKYIYILEKTFICKRCYPFFTNKRKELVKTPKIYFIDHGFRNQCAAQFDPKPQILGTHYENLVFSENRKKCIILKYWRTKNKAEVDFIKDDKIPIVVKKIPKVTRSFISYIKKYNREKGFIISEIEKDTRIVHDCKVKFLPFSKYI